MPKHSAFRWLYYSPPLWARPLLSRAGHLRQPCSRYRMRRTVRVPRRHSRTQFARAPMLTGRTCGGTRGEVFLREQNVSLTSCSLTSPGRRTQRGSVMSSHEQVLSNLPSLLKTSAAVLNRIMCFVKGFAAWMRSCADYWAAAAIYDSLNKLSDAELRKRGMSRATLVHDVFRSCDC